eukprot:4373383-Amphidinium_carterae.1
MSFDFAIAHTMLEEPVGSNKSPFAISRVLLRSTSSTPLARTLLSRLNRKRARATCAALR